MNGYGAYNQAYKKAAVSTVDQGKLIVMLYDGAIKFLNQAIEKMESGENYEAHTNLVRAKTIIAELLASLNMEKGGEIASNLQRLYTFMFNQLIDANLEKDATRVDHVVRLLKELRESWKAVPNGNQEEKAPIAPQLGSADGVRKINVRG